MADHPPRVTQAMWDALAEANAQIEKSGRTMDALRKKYNIEGNTMSDKHTDAQGEEAGWAYGRAKAGKPVPGWAFIQDQAEKFGGRVVGSKLSFPTAEGKQQFDIWYAENAPASLRVRSLFKPFHATEGQAQTSVAIQPVHVDAYHDDKTTALARRFIASKDKGYSNWPEDELLEKELFKTLAERQSQYRVTVAAQLADSTAPGAPVDRNAVLEEVAAYHDQMQINTSGSRTAWVHAESARHMRSLKSAAPTAQQSLTAGGAVPKACGWLSGNSSDGGEFLYWRREDAQFDCDQHNAYERSRPDFDAENLREPVPVFDAAPLPQVQSEALDAARYRHLRAGVQGGAYLQDGSVWVVRYKHPKGAIPELQSAGIGEELDRNVDAARAANQQPVTPSGALADNDGGVS